MEKNNNVMTGLGSPIFEDSEAKFQREQNFGRKLFIAAWAVEIMAASLGLLIAGFVAFDAYSQNPDHSGNSLLNAIMGALPFVLIAVIELTKIPLASGLYRVRQYGWKLLIFVALLALTIVTFETMFTGLERQMTNITARITDGKTEIQQIESSIAETERQITRISGRDVDSETTDINNQIAQAEEDGEQRLQNLAANHRLAVNSADELIISLTNQQTELQNSATSTFESEIASANERIERLTRNLEQTENEIDQIRADLRNDPRVTGLEAESSQIQELMNQTENLFNSGEDARIREAQIRIGVTPDGIFGNRTRDNFLSWRAQQEAKIASNDLEIIEIQNDLDDQLTQLLESEENIRNTLNSEIATRQALEETRAATIGTLISNPPTPELVLLGERLDQARADLATERERYSSAAEAIRQETQATLNLLIAQRSQIAENINLEKQSLPALQDEITRQRGEIVSIQNEMRQDARNNQVYRFAQKWGTINEDTGQREAYEDILQVTEKDLTFIGSIWFGSIAVICATIGTVLAFIANIMTDPDAFVEKQKSRKVRPVQRGLRMLFLLARKKLLKRRDVIEREKIVEIEKPVEVEKEVEKIVEVERIVEKDRIVEKEVEKLVPEIIPIPIFLPSDADHEVEMAKASKYYDAINNKVNEAIQKNKDS